MSLEQVNFPQRTISEEEKREIPEFRHEEERAVLRLQYPEIPRPVRPMYAFVRARTPELKPLETSPGVDMWAEFRYTATGEINYPYWHRQVDVDGELHEVVLHSVHGELPSGETYHHRALRCSCCLPDYKSYQDVKEEYQECPAKDIVINERAELFREYLNGLGPVDAEKLVDATYFLVSLIRANKLIWPPSDRSDRLLIDPLSLVYRVEPEAMRASAERLAQHNVVELHGSKHPSIFIAEPLKAA